MGVRRGERVRCSFCRWVGGIRFPHGLLRDWHSFKHWRRCEMWSSRQRIPRLLGWAGLLVLGVVEIGKVACELSLE